MSARDQVTRLLALVPYVRSHGEVSLEEAARALGVRPAQVVRDLNVLWFCGLPGLGMGDLIDVDMAAFEDEGDSVVRVSNADYLSRPLRLDSGEAAALVVALRTLRDATDDTTRPVVDRALAKLEAAAGEAAETASRVDVRLARPDPGIAATRTLLEQALAQRRQVRLGYYTPARDATITRVLDPLAVVERDDHVYLDAWCHQAEGQRLFRLDRVSSAELLDTPLEPHAVEPRDLAQGLFQASEGDVSVLLRLEPTARWVAEYYPVDDVTPRRGGRVDVRLRAGDPAWLVRLVLRLGGAAQVLEPAELGEEVRRRAQHALSHYGGQSPGRYDGR